MKELKIRQMRGYVLPRYPKGAYRKPDADLLRKMARAGSASAFLLLLSGCEGITGGGTTGPPPVDPDLPTEAQAKEVIIQTFAENGLTMVEDQNVELVLGSNESFRINLDGWDNSSKVGFEYHDFYYNHLDTLAEHYYYLDRKLDSLFVTEEGPYIKFMEPQNALGIEDNLDYLATLVQEMVDSLRAQGHI